MDLTKDEIEYILRRTEDDYLEWDMSMEACIEFPFAFASAETHIATCKSAKESLLRLQRKFEMLSKSMEDN